MEGFLHMKLPQWVIRLVTRLFALLPVIVVAMLFSTKKKRGPTLGILTSILIQWRYHSPSSIDLLHTKKYHGRVYQRQMEYLP